MNDNKLPAIEIKNIVPKGHKLYHLFNFIGLNYEKPEDILRAFLTIVNFDKGLQTLLAKDGHKKISVKNFFRLLRYTLPATFYGVEMVLKIKNYIKNNNENNLSEYDKQQISLEKLLGLKIAPDYNGDEVIKKGNVEFINKEILDWILKSPKTKGYKLKGFVDANNFEPIVGIPENKGDLNIYVIFEYNTHKILLQAKTKIYMGKAYLDIIQFISKIEKVDERKTSLYKLEMLMLKDFIQTFDIKKNVLEFNGGLTAKKRTVVKERINQYDIPSLIKNIRKVLKNGRKRGKGLVGRQGTGKSSVIRKLEEILTDIIIIKLSPSEFSSTSSIKRCFDTIKTIQPALVIIEDLDACGFEDKNDRTGTFINEIDDSNNDLNIFLLITINDPKLVNKTIIDRPGRIDEMDEIKPPQSANEIYEVMKSKYDKLCHAYKGFKNIPFPKQKQINEKIFKQCLKNDFTQAELTSGIIEKVLINVEDSNNFDFNTEIEKVVTTFQASKTDLKQYKFNAEEGQYKEEAGKVEVTKELFNGRY